MNVVPIIDLIATLPWATKTVNLFRHSIPAQVNSGVMVTTETAGSRPDYEIAGIHEARFQVIVRDPDEDVAMARALEIHDLLRIEQRTNLTAYVVDFIRPRHLPLPYRRSDGDLIEVSVNFDIRLFGGSGASIIIEGEGGHDW